MELTQLKYFQAVAKTKKIVTAAKSMFVTPPAISSAISQLEKELGTPLFSRIGNRLVLNRQGEILLQHTNNILFQYSSARAALMESLAEGPAHISAIASETHLFSDPIADFSIRYPDYSITLSATNRDTLFRGSFKNHYAFLMTTENSIPVSLMEECCCARLFEDLPAIAIRRDHPLAQRQKVTLADLVDYPLIHPRSYPDYTTRILSLFGEASLPLPLIRVYSHLVCHELLMQDDTVALTTTHSWTNGTEESVCVPLNVSGLQWTTFLFWHKNRILSEPEEAFLRFLSDYYRFDIPQT